MLHTYEEFVRQVDALGMMAMSKGFLQGFPTLEGLTADEQWHTGDPDTDPWQWKDRVAAEHRLAFGCLLGGYKGFVSKGMYPRFFAACRNPQPLEERYFEGHVTQTLRAVYALFQDGAPLSTSDIRARMGVTKKKGASAVDAAIVQLQREFLITVCGNARKIGKDGLPYGWPANAYCPVELWAGDFLDAPRLSQQEARQAILAHCGAWGLDIDLGKLKKRLFGG